MATHDQTFCDFWTEIKVPFLRDCVKAFIRFPIAIVIAIVVIRAMQCSGWMGDESDRSVACAEILRPMILASNIKAFLPILLIATLAGLPWLLLGAFYLEWDKYKKDRPHSFGVYGRRTAPNGGWLVSNFERIVSGKAWEKFVDVQLHKISDSETQLRGNFTDQEIITMVKAASKRFTSFLRKPNIETDRCLEWHIHANSGEEVKLRLERSADAAHNWILTASRYDWAGRKNPPTLVETHTTKFVVRRDIGSTQ
jgi:hypothetical protein